MAFIFSVILYALYKNGLMKDEDKYRGIVKSKGTLAQKDIIKRMLSQGSTLTRQDCLAAIDLYINTIGAALAEGYNVVTDGGVYSLSMRGNFDDLDDLYDGKRHELAINIQPGRLLTQSLSDVTMSKQLATIQQPRPEAYINSDDSQPNDVLTPGGLGRLTGHFLKYDHSDPEQGLFLVNGDANGIRIEMIGKRTAREVVFMVPPDLTPGEYTLQVRVRFGQDEHLVVGVLRQKLTVPAP
jgi:hypothetical protein